ncbi:MAG: hypothetical protein IJG38_01535 [Thermoguttaceae bacterium]|nr:hypothetical protein [Thermoguttaceae bacterium]
MRNYASRSSLTACATEGRRPRRPQASSPAKDLSRKERRERKGLKDGWRSGARKPPE